jgi:hypothetical protein
MKTLKTIVYLLLILQSSSIIFADADTANPSKTQKPCGFSDDMNCFENKQIADAEMVNANFKALLNRIKYLEEKIEILEKGISVDPTNGNLTVKGKLIVHSKQGAYASGTVPADGKWHSILKELSGHHGFELIADANISGCHGLTHAIALNTYMGTDQAAINKTQATHGPTSNVENCKIDIQWEGSTYNYSLQLKSNKDYGDGISITYFVTRIW